MTKKTFKDWYEIKKNEPEFKEKYKKYADSERQKQEFPDPMYIWAAEIYYNLRREV